MKKFPENLKYTSEHEWVKIENNKAIIGITDFAQSQLGDIVFVELPEVGQKVAKGDGLAVVESVKAVSDIYAPVSGTVIEVNDALEDSPELVNEKPYEAGFIAIIEFDDDSELQQLLDDQQYARLVEEEGGH